MSEKWLLDRDPLTGITEWYVPDEATNTFTIQTTQDVTDIVEANKNAFNQFSSARDGWGDKIGHSTHAATIPVNIYYDLVKRFGRDPQAWKRWLNDPDNAAFRTRPGTV